MPMSPTPGRLVLSTKMLCWFKAFEVKSNSFVIHTLFAFCLQFWRLYAVSFWQMSLSSLMLNGHANASFPLLTASASFVFLPRAGIGQTTITDPEFLNASEQIVIVVIFRPNLVSTRKGRCHEVQRRVVSISCGFLIFGIKMTPFPLIYPIMTIPPVKHHANTTDCDWLCRIVLCCKRWAEICEGGRPVANAGIITWSDLMTITRYRRVHYVL